MSRQVRLKLLDNCNDHDPELVMDITINLSSTPIALDLLPDATSQLMPQRPHKLTLVVQAIR